MSIHVIGAEDSVPQADLFYRITYIMKARELMRLQTYTELYKDKNGVKTITVFLSPYGFDTSSLTQSYLKLMDHAVMYGLNTMVIPLFPYCMERAECLGAACDAYITMKSACDVSVYLQFEDQAPLTKKERMILTIANYIAETSIAEGSDQRPRMPEPDQYNAEPAKILVRADAADSKEQFSINPISSASARFDPVSGVFQLDAGFGETVLKLIEAKGLTQSQCYTKANLTRAAFYKIRQSSKDPKSTYKPTKQTAMALAIALELDLEEAKNLLGRAGYSFSHSNREDIIVEYYLINGKYDILEINEMLYCYDLPLLGSQ